MPMAVQTVMLHTRDENEEEMDASFGPALIDQSNVFFSSDGGNVNRIMRGKEAIQSQQQQQQMFFSLKSPDPSQKPLHVSTGLQLALIKQNNNQIKTDQSDSLTSPYISDDIAAQIDNEKIEINQYFISNGDRLRRTLAEKHWLNYRALLQGLGKKLLEKDAEIRFAARCNSDLENRLGRLETESMTWQAKAKSEQALAASLHAQLQRALARAVAPLREEFSGESPAEDAESAWVDPNRRFEKPVRVCRACFRRPALVVLLPCCHLCLCVSCDFASAVGDGCPACGCFRTGSFQVSFG